MADLFEFGFAVLLILAVVTLLGHGLWLLAAALVRGLRRIAGTTDTLLPRLAAPCPRCRNARTFSAGRCGVCGYQVEPATEEDLQTAQSQLERLWQLNRIDANQYEAVRLAIAGELLRLRSAAAPAPIRHTTEPVPLTPPAIHRSPPAPAPAPVTGSQPVVDDAEATPIVEAELVQPTHPLDMAEPEAAAAPPHRFSARPAVASMLQAFMDEKNIRWGELASGILIVGSAIGLIISLRATLAQLSEQVPYFPALLFMLGTAAIHAAGLYTLRRWKLRSTSRGVLVIATLLVPLSFAAGIVLAGEGPARVSASSPLYLAVVLVGVLGYGTVTGLSARALFPVRWWPLVVAVMVPSIGQLVINRLATFRTDALGVLWMSALFMLPTAGFLVATLAQLSATTRGSRLTPARAVQTFTVLGIAVFSLVVPLALLLWLRPDPRESLAELSPMLSVLAAVVVGFGLAIHQRCTTRAMTAAGTAGTALAIFGAMLMLGTVALAWPRLDNLIVVITTSGTALMLLGWMGVLPILWGVAVALFSAAFLIGWHRFAGRLVPLSVTSSHLVDTLLMGRSGVLLLLPGAAVAVLAALLERKRRGVAARTFWWSAAGLSLVSLFIGLYAGFVTRVDGDWTTPLFGIFAVTSLLVAARRADARVAWLGAGLLLVFLVHLFGWNQWAIDRLAWLGDVLRRPLLLALLAHALAATFTAGLLALATRPGRSRAAISLTAARRAELIRAVVHPLVWSGVITAAWAVPAVLLVRGEAYRVHALYSLLVTLAWFAAGLTIRHRLLISVGQAFAAFAISLAIAAIAQDRSWPGSPWREMWHWQFQLSVLGLWCAVCAGSRVLARRAASVRSLLHAPWPQPDQILLGLLTVVLLGVAVAGVAPAALAELNVISSGDLATFSQWRGDGYLVGGWIALSCVALALIVAAGERWSPIRSLGLCLATAVVPLLVAVPYEAHWAAASALRWAFAAYALVWILLIAARHPIGAALERLWAFQADRQQQLHAVTRNAALVAGLLPVVALTAAAALLLCSGRSLAGPRPDCWLGTITESQLYAGPLLMLVAALLIAAVRDRLPAAALTGSLLFQWVLVLGVSIPVLSQGMAWTTLTSVQLLQWSACGLVAYGAFWLALRRWIEPAAGQGVPSPALQVQLAAATLAVIGLAGWASFEIARAPSGLSLSGAALGTWTSVAAVVGWVFLMLWAYPGRQAAAHVLSAGAWAVLSIAATYSLVGRWVMWPHYHQLAAYWLCLAYGTAIVLYCVPARGLNRLPAIGIRWWGTAFAAGVAVLTLRAYLIDPLNPWWTFTVLGLLAGLLVAFGLQARQSWHAYASILLSMLAASIVWHEYRRPAFEPGDIVFVNLLAAAGMAMAWLAAELWRQRQSLRSGRTEAAWQRAHRVVALFNILLLLLIVGVAFASALLDGSRDNTVATPWAIASLFATVVLLTGTLWDHRSRWVPVGWYASGLVAIGMGLHLARAEGWIAREETLAGLSVAGALLIALTGHLWKWGLNLARLGERIGIAQSVAELRRTGQWLPATNLVGTGIVCLVGLLIVLTAELRALRMTVAAAPLLSAYGVACLSQGQRERTMRCLSLLVAGLAAVYAGWASMEPAGGPLTELRYAVQLVIVSAMLTVIYGLVVPRIIGPMNAWYDAVRRTAVVVAGVTLAALAAVLIMEVVHFRPGEGVALDTPQVVAVSVMLGGLVAALLSMAILPGRDPLALGETGRGVYVYLAQLVAALLFAHLYLTKPQLFDSILRPYWPYLVVLLAFVSVALGELFQRMRWRVLAEPIQRTGGFLPLIPALGIWLFSSQSNHTLVLFFAGLIYVMLAVVRRSYLAGLLAAVAGNGAFWSLLHDTGFSLLAQPQFWLIPPAVSVLVAAQVNRQRLTDAQLTTVRYISVIIIYLSSSGEMFMKLLAPETAGDWSRPVILASLAVLGMFAGIVLRIRAFLYLGASFLLLAVVAMVWNAARLVEHTWPWWVFGITLGLFILLLFGLFEKYRREMVQLVQQLRQWEA